MAWYDQDGGCACGPREVCDCKPSPIGPEQKRLMDRLFNGPNKLINFSVTVGEQHCTAEELCAELNRAFDEIENGKSVPYKNPPDFVAEMMDVRQWLKENL